MTFISFFIESYLTFAIKEFPAKKDGNGSLTYYKQH